MPKGRIVLATSTRVISSEGGLTGWVDSFIPRERSGHGVAAFGPTTLALTR
jgi:hypothetical protein